MPTMMHSAYARIGTGPRCQTPCAGLGMLARITPVTLLTADTGRHCERSRSHSSGQATVRPV